MWHPRCSHIKCISPLLDILLLLASSSGMFNFYLTA